MRALQENNAAGFEEEDAQKGRYLTFFLGAEYYGVDLRNTAEIIGMQSITRVPGLPDYIKGIINLRGRVVPVMDVRLRFGEKPLEYSDRTCIIVMEREGISIGLIVDGVSDVWSIAERDVVPPPEFYAIRNRYIMGIGQVENGVRLILDCDRLLNGQ